MDDELKRRLDEIERKVESTRNLVHLGIPTVTGLDSKVNALIDSQVRLYDSLDQLTQKMQGLTDAQAATERSLKTLIESLEPGTKPLRFRRR